jgi:CheY-like chemotaxis protein
MNIGLGSKRKTILLVDPDPHARAALRAALEKAGFSVGEAANGREGARTTARIKPDAILADLMMEVMDDSTSTAGRFREAGTNIPFYVVSTASDALVGAVGLHEMGICGVFLKPVDSSIVIQTLKTRLGASLPQHA